MASPSKSPSPGMPAVALPTGEVVPALGQGTWRMGDDAGRRKEEIAALRHGFDLGLTLLDTAEMYGDGAAEELCAEAMTGRRADIFLVTKVLPSNASARGTVAACERSLKRLGTDYIDLYLLHWRGGVPLAETVGAFAQLQKDGKIRHWGVSNLDLSDMEELLKLPGGNGVATNQVLYNVSRRGAQYDLVPWSWKQRIPIMAYSPVEQGRLLGKPALQTVAARHGATAAQVALAWLLRQAGIIAIPKAGSSKHVRENHGALALKLTADDLAELDRAFPPPKKARPLEML